MDRDRFSARNVDREVIDMIRELRNAEQRHVGGILGEAIRQYWSEVFCDGDDGEESSDAN